MELELLIKQANELAKAKPSYHYNPQTIEKIIRDGVIPEGAVIAHVGDQKLVREGDEVVCYKDGKATKRTPIDDNMMPHLLVQYAVTAAYAAAPSVKMGMVG